MLQQLYGWIQNIAVYLIVAAAVMHAIPGKDYGKYVRFFSGLVLILLLFTPVLNLTGMVERFTRAPSMKWTAVRSRRRENGWKRQISWTSFLRNTAGWKAKRRKKVKVS